MWEEITLFEYFCVVYCVQTLFFILWLVKVLGRSGTVSVIVVTGVAFQGGRRRSLCTHTVGRWTAKQPYFIRK